MKTVAMLLLSLLLLGGGERYIEWSKERVLTWDDFKGAPDEETTMKAHTHSNLSVTWGCDENVFKFGVVAKFDTEDSWKKATASENLLAHEQLHFDIAELFARKMRQHFDLVSDGCSLTDEEVGDQVREIMDAWSDYENKYDVESRHSLDRTVQAQWELKVKNELQKLKRYALL